ncbi:hypothetical protein BpHYR1_032911 [Brachionus plicatilis]|uniref:Uncharacterized protein n=1 Tax=Brachionus plicatilis TaxID=10195 RepID=A0A3M7T525_BRAPC|nr:hypothetical protein BpHYR1_032911 [Brachionus plicatilis]
MALGSISLMLGERLDLTCSSRDGTSSAFGFCCSSRPGCDAGCSSLFSVGSHVPADWAGWPRFCSGAAAAAECSWRLFRMDSTDESDEVCLGSTVELEVRLGDEMSLAMRELYDSEFMEAGGVFIISDACIRVSPWCEPLELSDDTGDCWWDAFLAGFLPAEVGVRVLFGSDWELCLGEPDSDEERDMMETDGLSAPSVSVRLSLLDWLWLIDALCFRRGKLDAATDADAAGVSSSSESRVKSMTTSFVFDFFGSAMGASNFSCLLGSVKFHTKLPIQK